MQVERNLTGLKLKLQFRKFPQKKTPRNVVFLTQLQLMLRPITSKKKRAKGKLVRPSGPENKSKTKLGNILNNASALAGWEI